MNIFMRSIFNVSAPFYSHLYSVRSEETNDMFPHISSCPQDQCYRLKDSKLVEMDMGESSYNVKMLMQKL